MFERPASAANSRVRRSSESIYTCQLACSWNAAVSPMIGARHAMYSLNVVSTRARVSGLDAAMCSFIALIVSVADSASIFQRSVRWPIGTAPSDGDTNELGAPAAMQPGRAVADGCVTSVRLVTMIGRAARRCPLHAMANRAMYDYARLLPL